MAECTSVNAVVCAGCVLVGFVSYEDGVTQGPSPPPAATVGLCNCSCV